MFKLLFPILSFFLEKGAEVQKRATWIIKGLEWLTYGERSEKVNLKKGWSIDLQEREEGEKCGKIPGCTRPRKKKVAREYDWSVCNMLKCTVRVETDQLFQLILNPGTTQHWLKI